MPGFGRKPYATWILIGINLAVWLLTEATGGSEDVGTLARLGAASGERIASGEYWRLFTAIFLHAGLMHLGLNCLGLFILGRQLEAIYGQVRFIALYLISGIAGSVVSYALNLSLATYAIGVGASGAVFGILGGLVAFFLYNRDFFGSAGRQTLVGLLVIAGVNFVFGLTTQGVDNYAHLGGFVAGVALGIALGPRYAPVFDMFGYASDVVDKNSIARRWWIFPIAAALLAAGVILGDRNVGDSPTAHLLQAQEHRAESDLAAALDELDKALEIDPLHAPSYIERALVMAELGNIDRALSDAANALKFSRTRGEQETARRLLVQLQVRR